MKAREAENTYTVQPSGLLPEAMQWELAGQMKMLQRFPLRSLLWQRPRVEPTKYWRRLDATNGFGEKDSVEPCSHCVKNLQEIDKF